MKIFQQRFLWYILRLNWSIIHYLSHYKCIGISPLSKKNLSPYRIFSNIQRLEYWSHFDLSSLISKARKPECSNEQFFALAGDWTQVSRLPVRLEYEVIDQFWQTRYQKKWFYIFFQLTASITPISTSFFLLFWLIFFNHF